MELKSQIQISSIVHRLVTSSEKNRRFCASCTKKIDGSKLPTQQKKMAKSNSRGNAKQLFYLIPL